MDASNDERPRRPGKREETRAKNRETILDAARRVFAELGYGSTTVRDIIRATPLASGTFYNYFKSKEEVYEAIRDATALRIRPALRAARADAASVEAFVAGTFRTFFDYVAAERAGLAAGRAKDSLRVRVDTPEIIAGFEELREDIDRGIRRGVFPRADAGFLMAAMAGVAFEVADEMMRRPVPDPESAARFATALFLGGIGALPPQA